MFLTIVTSIATFMATGFDEIVVLTIIFLSTKDKNDIKKVYIGQQIAMIVLVLISLLAVFGIASIPRAYVGLLGFIPLIQGIRVLLNKEDDSEYEKKDIIKRMGSFNNLIWSVAIIAIAGGAEELTIYIPFFASLDSTNLIIALITFMVLVPIWVTICRKFSSIKHIQNIVEKYEKIIVPVVFVLLGAFVLLENGTLTMILDLIQRILG